MPPRPIRVAAVDDHPVMLRGVQAAAARAGSTVHFVAMAGTVHELLGTNVEADVVLLDLRLKDASRPRDNVRLLRSRGMRVLVYTEGDRHHWITDALRAGARGVVTKTQDEAELLQAIRTVYDGGRVLAPDLEAMLGQSTLERPALAPREEEALTLVARGLADKQAARLMGISEDTVKEYLKRIRVKYNEVGRPAASRVDLHLRAQEDGYLTDLPDLDPIPETGPETGPETEPDAGPGAGHGPPAV